MISFLKKYWLIIIFSLLIGLIHYFPQLLFEWQLGKDYQGFYILTSSDEYTKVAKVQEVYDGHYLSPNALAYEYKDALSPEGINITELLIGLLGKTLHLSAIQITLLLKFVIPIILFLLLYYLSFLITNSKFGSLIPPTLILLGSQLKSPQLVPSIIKQIIDFQYQGFLIYLRPSFPSFSSIFFFAAFIFLFLFFKTKNLNYGFWAGVSFGLLFYIYAFFWVFIVVILGLMGIFGLIRRDWDFFKKVVVVFLLGLSIGSFYLYTYLNHGVIETTLDGFQLRQTFFMTHRFIFDKVVVVTFFLYSGFLLYLSRKKQFKREYLFPYFLVISALIVSNQQVITGREIQYHHWYWFTNLPSAFFALAILLIYILEDLKIKARVRNIAIFTLLALLILFGVGLQYSSYRADFFNYQYFQNYSYIFNWLNKNTVKDSVVYSDYYFVGFISAFTHSNVYWSQDMQFNATTPLERVLHNYFIFLRLNFNLDSEKIRQYLQEHKEEVANLVLSFKVIDAQCGGNRICYSDEILDFLAERYKKFLQLSVEQQLKKYRLDYLIWDYNKYPNIYLNLNQFFKEVYQHNNIFIYQIIN